MMRFRAAAIVGLVLVAGAGAAFAANDDRGAAEAALRDVEASPKKAVASELVAKARAELGRASSLRNKGDDSHARMAETAARAWAETARDTVKAATVEETATRARLDANDAGSIADRERALLEEAVAQSGRLRAQLEAAPNKEKELPARTSTQANLDGGAPRKPAEKGGKAPRPAATVDGGAR